MKWEHETIRKKLTQWYWCGVFGELYGGANETRFARDFVEVLAWIEGASEPSTLKDAAFRAERLDTMTSRLSAAYKGVHALLMSEGARDFRSGQPFNEMSYFDEAVDIHHIFPRAWCKENVKSKTDRYDTIVNKTPLSYRTNRIIGGYAPSHYLAQLPKQGGASGTEIDRHLRSHLIEPACLREDDFDSFFAARREALIGLIQRAMGKAVYRGETPDEPEGVIAPEEAEAMEAA